MAHRLPPRAGELIVRDTPVSFSFEGEAYTGCVGDTVSSALLANGRRVLGRSFKYHRPRGVMSAANHDVNVLLQTPTRLNVRGDVETIEPGGSYTVVNTWGGVARDRLRFIEWLSPLLPVGFYYKAFYRPRWLFPFWERLIRRVSGLGAVHVGFPCTRPASQRAFCDCLVIGAGAAGLAAARALAQAGVQVIVADEQAAPGGSLRFTGVDPAAREWRDETLAQLATASNVALRPASFAAGLYSDFEVPLVGPGGLTQVTARSVIIATGAIAQPAVFRHNDLPGVMLATAAQRLAHGYGVAVCERAVVLAGHAEAYVAALDLLDCGIPIEAVLDLEDTTGRGPAADTLRARGVRLLGRISDLVAHADKDELARVSFRVAGIAEEIACDGLLVSVGWAAATQLLHQGGVQFVHDPVIDQMVPAALPPGLAAAGRVNGCFDFAARVADGEAAAHEILSTLGHATAPPVARPPRAATRHSHPKPWFDHPRGRNFVDFDEDIQLVDLRTACREGFDNVELLKRYTTNGMGPSQGKHSNLNAARWLADYHGTTLGAVGATTARPFYHPVPLGVLAGRRVRAVAESALNPLHEAARAEWLETGAWRRPRFYRQGSAQASRLAEYQAVRQRIGMIDVSTLGKFEIFGPDAGRLLALAYTSAVDRTAVGRTRYVLMCDHRGTIVDDGVAARIADDHFYLTAGTTHAAASFRQLTQVAALFDLDVELVDVTRHRAAINLAGPQVRAVLREVTPQALDDTAFPFLGVRDTTLCGIPVRMMRVGFVGEAGYEVHAAYTDGPRLWREFTRLGGSHGILPFGVETQRLLRLEKGHLIVGQDTDGIMHPYETPLAGMVNPSKPHFLGKAALEVLREAPARRIVGFEVEDTPDEDIEECHLVIAGGGIAGRVTSVGYSPVLARTVGLAVIERTADAPPPSLTIRLTSGRQIAARTVATSFYDPDNLRQQEGVA